MWYFCIFATGCTVCPLPLVTVHLNETLCASNHRPRLAVWSAGAFVCPHVCVYATTLQPALKQKQLLFPSNPFCAPTSTPNFLFKEFNPCVSSHLIHSLCATLHLSKHFNVWASDALFWGELPLDPPSWSWTGGKNKTLAWFPDIIFSRVTVLWVSLKLNWLCCLLSHLWQYHRVADEVKQDAIQHVFVEVEGGISSCQSPATLRYLSPRRVAIHHIKSCSGLNNNEAFDRMAFSWDQGVFVLSASNKFLAFFDAKEVYWCVYYRCILILRKGGESILIMLEIR